MISNKMNKLYGAYNIAKFIGYEGNYADMATFLRVFEVAQVRNKTNVLTYCITEDQANKLKEVIESIKRVFKEEE